MKVILFYGKLFLMLEILNLISSKSKSWVVLKKFDEKIIKFCFSEELLIFSYLLTIK